MRHAIAIIWLMLAGCVVQIPHGRIQLACDRSLSERPRQLRCDRRYPFTVIWKFK